MTLRRPQHLPIHASLVLALAGFLLASCGNGIGVKQPYIPRNAPPTADASSGTTAISAPSEYVVQRGDTLYGIARRYNVPPRALIEANSLQAPYQLNAGRKLTVPQGRVHTVEAGETLSSIAKRYGVDSSSIVRTNDIPPPYAVRVGQQLILPGAVQEPGANGPGSTGNNSFIATVNPGPTAPPPAAAANAGVEVTSLAPPGAAPAAPSSSSSLSSSAVTSAPLAQPSAAQVSPAAPQPAETVTTSTTTTSASSTGPVPLAPPSAAVTPAPPPATPQPALPQPALVEPPQAAVPAPTTTPPAATAPDPVPVPVPSQIPPLTSAPATSAPQQAAAAAPSPGDIAPPTAPPPPRAGKTFLWPLRGRVIATYGDQGKGLHNDGLNITAPRGTPVRAAENGVVAYAGNEIRGFGNLLLIRHADGYMTAYAHNDTLLVQRGDTVRRGQTISRVGNSGNVGEPQLHFEIRKGTQAVDPEPLLGNPSGASLPTDTSRLQ